MSPFGRMLIILVAGATMSSGSSPAAAQESKSSTAAVRTDAQWLADFAAAKRLDELARLAANNKNFIEAAAYWDRAARHSENIRGKLGGWMALRAAEAYAKNGQPNRALQALKLAEEQGFRNAAQILANSDFAKLRSAALSEIIAAIKENDRHYRLERSIPDNAKLITEDIPRFWAAYDRMKKAERKADKAAILRRYYLAPGSRGLIDYHWIKTQSMELLVDRIAKSPDYYDGIRSASLTVASYEPKIRNAFIKVKSLYPDAYFPDITFVIGRLNSGGTAGPGGMLIGVEVWSWSKGISLAGISPGFQKVVTGFSLDNLPYVVVHEQMHAMQNYAGENTLLKAALQEGSADFITMLALPESTPPAHHVWGLANEAAIWARFKQEMTGEDISEWIGNNSDATEQWPADLGYFVGARISQAYYNRADDKTEAIRNLLNVNDPQKILDQSGYASRFLP